mgnify:CR=1 FL=1
MKKISLVILSITLLVSLGACRQKSVPAFKSSNFATGKAGEMILVLDTNQWSKAGRAAVYKVLQQPQPAINQIQPMFDIIQCNEKDFKASFTHHRNIVRFDYNKEYGNNSFSIEQNTWANPQVYVKIRGNNLDSCLALFLTHQDEIIKAMYDNDLLREQNADLKMNNPEVEKKIKEKFGISMTIPERYFIGREEKNFIWLCCRTPKNDRFIMVYSLPAYEMNEANMIDARNRVTKAFIQGAVPGAYPIVANVNGFPITQAYQQHYHTGMEMRGLWASVRDKMGGPFYSFTMLSSDKASCITVDGFVYAPQEQKRDYLREVEAIVKSIK